MVVLAKIPARVFPQGSGPVPSNCTSSWTSLVTPRRVKSPPTRYRASPAGMALRAGQARSRPGGSQAPAKVRAAPGPEPSALPCSAPWNLRRDASALADRLDTFAMESIVRWSEVLARRRGVPMRRTLTTFTIVAAAVLLIPATATAVDTDPKPIPGGLPVDDEIIHVFVPGPVDLGFMGENVEPNVITDFNGFTAMGYVNGTATDAEGNSYT